MTEGDRLPPEASGESPFGVHYYGPFGPRWGPTVDPQPAMWQPPLLRRSR